MKRRYVIHAILENGVKISGISYTTSVNEAALLCKNNLLALIGEQEVKDWCGYEVRDMVKEKGIGSSVNKEEKERTGITERDSII